jgi:hypothetical protein
MKNDVMPSIVQMDAEELQKLTTEVKETVATINRHPKVKQKTEKSFGPLDMWSIRRNFRSASDLIRKR